MMVENTAHGFVPIEDKIDPIRIEISCMIADFLDEHLR